MQSILIGELCNNIIGLNIPAIYTYQGVVLNMLLMILTRVKYAIYDYQYCIRVKNKHIYGLLITHAYKG